MATSAGARRGKTRGRDRQRSRRAAAVEAALEAARPQFRPILMTSLAFILGVLPLAVSTGAGAAARQSVGTGVMGGMLAATFLAIFFVPLFFKLISDGWRRKHALAPLPLQNEVGRSV